MKKNNENAITHEELCAYVFGEVDTELSARVARALEADEALRAEHAALTATIGLVKSSCTAAEVLSPQMLSDLEAAARPVPQVNPWYTSTPIRMAAGIAALAAGVLGGRAMMDREASVAPTEVAQLDLAASRVPVVNELELLGAEVPELESALVPNAEAPVVAGQAEVKLERAAKDLMAKTKPQGAGDLKRARELSGSAALPEEVLGELRSLGYVGSTPEESASTGAGGTYHVAVDGWAASRGDTGNPQGAGGGSYRGPGDSSPGGSDDFFLGHGQAARGGGPSSSASTTSGYGTGTASGTRGVGGVAIGGRAGGAGHVFTGPAAPGATKGKFGGRRQLLRAQRDELLDSSRRLSASDDGEAFSRAYEDSADSDDAYSGLLLNLTQEQADELCKQRVERILQNCRRYPNERPRDMFFRYWGDNAFELARLDNLSTFSVDVDTASYTLARRYLTEGTLPEKAQIRTEEFVNYFKPDIAAPTEGTFAVHTDLTPSRFGGDANSDKQRYMLRVVVRGREVAASERKPLALTFVIDVSGSMKEGGRLELVKHSLRMLTTQLDARDSLAIVAFSTEARLVLPMTSAANRGLIESALYGLHPGGGTNAESGLKMGYEVARTALTSEVHNRVVLLSDGVANIGQTDQERLNSDVKARRAAGIFLNTIGVGMTNHNDAFLEQLADKGDGLCNYIDSAVEARRALVENFTGAFEPIARDVKIQVVFDEDQVSRYRLLGYENRAIADADFRNDAVDAGEVGAGHQVVALYELELTGKVSDAALAQVNLRWKAPTGAGRDPLEDSATERSFQVSAEQLTTWEGASDGYKRSVLVAQFAEILRRSVHARGDSIDELIAESAKLATQMKDPDFDELVAMLQKSRELIIKHLPRRDTLTMCIDSIRRNHILRAQYEELRQTQNQTVIAELERQNQELEQRIEQLIRGELEAQVK